MFTTPTFWSHKGIISTALVPLSWVWRGLGWLRHRIARQQAAELPVICVGNLTAGGTGKTPIVGLIYDQLSERGLRPAILSRGYGGNHAGPLWVDPTVHDSAVCGDEPLMLARGRQVLIGRDRVMGAQAIAAHGSHDVIIMDDGMQNPFLEKDIVIGVFDGAVGIGNGRVIPAGPLRLGVQQGVSQLDLAIINGVDEVDIARHLSGHMPVFTGNLQPDATTIDRLADTPIIAFAGIGRPKRFFATLRKSGANIVQSHAFADHHPYSQADLTALQADATRLAAQLITTEKDWMRLPVAWRDQITYLPVTMEIAQISEVIDQLLTGCGLVPPATDNVTDQ